MTHMRHSALAHYTGELDSIDSTSEQKCGGQSRQYPVGMLAGMDDWPRCVTKSLAALPNAHLIFESTSPWYGESALNLERSLQSPRPLSCTCDGDAAKVQAAANSQSLKESTSWGEHL